MTSYPALAALTPPAFEPSTAPFDHRLTEESGRAFAEALKSDFEFWGAGGEAFAEWKVEELVEKLTTAIPGEYWFSAPGATSAKLLFSSYGGFSLLIQVGSREKHRAAREINELLKTIGYAR